MIGKWKVLINVIVDSTHAIYKSLMLKICHTEKPGESLAT